MPSKIDKVPRRLLDIVENVDAALKFVADLNYEQFAMDNKSQYAVIRALEIISEASRHIPDDIKAKHPEIPWRAVRDAGNAYRHAYLSVTLEVVWETVTRDLEPLRNAMIAELRSRGVQVE